MKDESRCRGCGNLLPDGALNGLCPVCLLREGLVGDADDPAWSDTGPFMSGSFAAAGALATLDKTLGGLPRVLLGDSELSDGPGPLVQPGSSEMPAIGDRPGRLQLLGEIARGGMGVILKGRDPDLGRDLAVKVLLESHRDKPDLIRRFIEEAQIGGQLQHPGIVPIYELGVFADHRPYFAMKLVKGCTLSSLLDERSDRVHDLPRLLSIFEAVCQTIAYAHARGVIHRDLKPSNIMVGSFGEVQVMDWGLAKVLPQGGATDDASAGKSRERNTVIATARCGADNDSDLSKAGSVMGTPSYMAPEQARGEVERLDERCDVFALGSILCELLAGEPAFTGRSSGEIQRKASRGELKEALTRLDSGGADVDLIALAKDCLASELEDRPRHAGTVAERITAHRTGVQERLRQAEIARAEERTRAEEATKRVRVERDRLRLTVALAASVLGLVFLGGGGWLYLSQLKAARRSATERGVAQALDEANVLFGKAKAASIGDLSMWPDAFAAVKHARSLLRAGEPSPAIRDQIDQLQATLEHEQDDAVHRAAEADRDRKFVERLERIRLASFEQGQTWVVPDYATAFREFGIDIVRLDPTEAGRRLKERSNPMELAFFLDDWALVRREALSRNGREERDADSWRSLIAVACATDPDSWRNALRTLVGAKDRDTVKRFAEDEKALETQPPKSLLLLAQVLEAQENKAQAEKMLKRAWLRRPDDFWICSQLARISDKERVRFASAAVALRPSNPWARAALAEASLASEATPRVAPNGRARSWMVTDDPAEGKKFHQFASFRGGKGVNLNSLTFVIYPKVIGADFSIFNSLYHNIEFNDEVIHEYREAARLAPQDASIHCRLARLLTHKVGRLEEAFSEYRVALKLQPGSDLQIEFASYLIANGKLDEAILQFKEATRLDPKDSFLHIFLGSLLQKQGNLHAALSEFRQAFLLYDSRGGSEALNILARFLHVAANPEDQIAVLRERMRLHPEDAFVITHIIGDILRSQGKFDEEIAVYREAIRLNPKVLKIHALFAQALAKQGKLDASKAEFHKEISLHRDAVRRNPDDSKAHVNYATVLFDQGKWDEALKELREIIRIDHSSNPFSSFGNGFYSGGRVGQALALLREAVRLKPADPDARNALGYYLLDFGEADSALAEIREALRLQPNNVSFLDSLGWAHLARGELKEALTNLREANRLVKDQPDAEMQAHMQRVERLAVLEGRLDAILRGRDVPADTDGKLDVAELCRVTGRFSAAARFYREALLAKPALAEDVSSQHRLHAAIAAAQAGTSDPSPMKPEGEQLDDAERVRWRAQALDWLRAEKDSCAKIVAPTVPATAGAIPAVATGPPKLALARKTLVILTHHRGLACVRGEKELARLPEPERAHWQEFWADVAALLKKADSK